MNVAERRAFIDAIKGIAGKNRAWLDPTGLTPQQDLELFAFNGWGVVLNSAQSEALADIVLMEPGTIHVWEWANRVGKTTGLMILHSWAIWRKWRYLNADLEFWLKYRYRTLHAAPTGRLMGRAWGTMETFIEGSGDQQRSPVTLRQRPAVLAPFFSAGKSVSKDGSDELWVKCANGAQIDFLSTHDGAGRLESEAWWLIGWDEFPRHQPVIDVPLLIDQTFLPRSSDYMAPVILSGTATDDSDAVYAEIEEQAAHSPRYWHVSRYARSVNPSQSKASIERQRAVSMDSAVSGRSLDGGLGEGGRGTLLPRFLLDNAFVDMPAVGEPEDEELVLSSFDHALRGDLNVVSTLALPWPIYDANALIGSVRGIALAERKSSNTLTPDLQASFMSTEIARAGSRWVIIDATAEGGLMVYRQARQKGLPAIDCNFTGRLPGVKVSNKEYGLQMLQRMFAWGLDVQAEENGWITDWPEVDRPFGLFRLPRTWVRLRRELGVLRRDDEHQHQDRAMTFVMLAWWLGRYLVRGTQAESISFNVMANRRSRSRYATGVR